MYRKALELDGITTTMGAAASKIGVSPITYTQLLA